MTLEDPGLEVWFSQNRRDGFQVAKLNRQERKARKVF
jgi:hypothetical protein